MLLSWLITGPLVYLAVVVCVAVVLYKVKGYASMPRHLRWDLYPVPHQGEQGSKYQTLDFSRMPSHFSIKHEMKAMMQEMLFIKKAFDNNRTLWKGSFPLHMGLYVMAVWVVAMLLGAGAEILGNSGVAVPAGVVSLLQIAAQFAGAVGFAAGLIGSLILLWQRYSNEDLRRMSDFVAYFNLYLLTAMFGLALAAWLFADPDFSILRHQLASLLMLKPGVVSEPLVVLELLAMSIFLLVLPFSRMMHFAAKYFFFHNIMWDDELMKRGSTLEQDVTSSLHLKTTWSAAHVYQQASWGEQALGVQEEKGGKTDEEKAGS